MSDIESDDDFFVTSNSEDSDFEVELNEPQQKNENYLEQIIPQYDDKTFFEHFRISRQLVNNIALRYEESNYYKRNLGQYGNLSPLNQVLIFLWYLGHQTASFRDVGDRFNVTISSINRIIQRVTLCLSNLSPQIIKWPGEDEKRNIEQNFRENGFPNVIGALDGCHIKIDKPANDPDSYINRKSYYSIQLQVICDHRRKILDVFMGYPGSVHDSRMLRNSPIGNNLEEKCGGFYILADSGYPLQRNLLTPFKNRGNLTQRQLNYNIILAKNRYVIKHCFGILKQKFRQLYHIKLRKIIYIVHLIRAACVLHNIATDDEFELNNINIPLNENMVYEQFDEENDDH